MKKNPLESNPQRHFEKTGFVGSPPKRCSDEFFDEQFGSRNCDVTDEDKGTSD